MKCLFIDSYLALIVCTGMKWPWNQRCLFCRSQLPVHFSRVNIAARDVRLCVCSLSRPTRHFHVAFPINCVLYVCMPPFLSGAVYGIPAVCGFFVMLCHRCNWPVFMCFLHLLELISDARPLLCSLQFSSSICLMVKLHYLHFCHFVIVVCLVVLLNLVRGCGGLLCHWWLYTHTRPENFPAQGVRSVQLDLWRLCGRISLSSYRFVL